MASAPASPAPRSEPPAAPKMVGLFRIIPSRIALAYHSMSMLGRLPMPMMPHGASPPEILKCGNLTLLKIFPMLNGNKPLMVSMASLTRSLAVPIGSLMALPMVSKTEETVSLTLSKMSKNPLIFSVAALIILFAAWIGAVTTFLIA